MTTTTDTIRHQFLDTQSGQARIDRTVTELLATLSATRDQLAGHVALRRAISFSLAYDCVCDSLDRLYATKAVRLDVDHDGVLVYRRA